MRTQRRGSALIITIVALMVITVIGVGMIRLAGREAAGAFSGLHEQEVVACAEAARLRLLSTFQALGFQASQVQALNLPLGTNSARPQATAVGGHYDTPPINTVVDQVTYLPESAFGPTSAARDLSGISSLVGQGGRPLKVTVFCQAGSGRSLEVEFGIRFGL